MAEEETKNKSSKPKKIERTIEESFGAKDETSFKIRSMSRREKILRYLALFLVSIFIVIIVFYAALIILKLFPDYILVSSENSLLNIIINVDGILLGFTGIIFAQLLSSIMDQQNTLFQSALDKGDTTLNKKKTIEFLDFRRNGLAIDAGAIFLFLLMSIFYAMSNIAKISSYSATDTFASSILFGPLLLLMLGVVLLMVAFIAMPMTPPLEKF
jgi:hypothetical protein